MFFFLFAWCLNLHGFGVLKQFNKVNNPLEIEIRIDNRSLAVVARAYLKGVSIFNLNNLTHSRIIINATSKRKVECLEMRTFH